MESLHPRPAVPLRPASTLCPPVSNCMLNSRGTASIPSLPSPLTHTSFTFHDAYLPHSLRSSAPRFLHAAFAALSRSAGHLLLDGSPHASGGLVPPVLLLACLPALLPLLWPVLPYYASFIRACGSFLPIHGLCCPPPSLASDIFLFSLLRRMLG